MSRRATTKARIQKRDSVRALLDTGEVYDLCERVCPEARTVQDLCDAVGVDTRQGTRDPIQAVKMAITRLRFHASEKIHHHSARRCMAEVQS